MRRCEHRVCGALDIPLRLIKDSEGMDFDIEGLILVPVAAMCAEHSLRPTDNLLRANWFEGRIRAL